MPITLFFVIVFSVIVLFHDLVEAYCAPVEGTANGKLVVEPNWYPNLKEKMTLVFKDGYVTKIIGGGKIGDEYRNLLDFTKNEEPLHFTQKPCRTRNWNKPKRKKTR